MVKEMDESIEASLSGSDFQSNGLLHDHPPTFAVKADNRSTVLEYQQNTSR